MTAFNICLHAFAGLFATLDSAAVGVELSGFPLRSWRYQRSTYFRDQGAEPDPSELAKNPKLEYHGAKTEGKEKVNLIDINKILHAVTLSREGSYVKAADRLFLSQSAVTRSIQTLEREVGIRIFERSKSGVHLTTAGAQFLGKAEDLLRHAETFESDLKLLNSGQGGTLAFGIGPMAAAIILPELLNELTASTAIRLQVSIGSDRNLRRQLLNGEIEFYVGGRTSTDSAHVKSHRFEAEVLTQSDISVLVRAGHPLAGCEAIDPEQLASFPVVGGSLVRGLIGEELLARAGLQIPSLEVDNYDLLIRVALANDVLLIANEKFAHERSASNGCLVILPVNLNITSKLELCLISLSQKPLSVAGKKVAEMIRHESAERMGL